MPKTIILYRHAKSDWGEDNEHMLKPLSLVEKELWAIYKKSDISSNELIKERREEAKREDKKSTIK